MIWSLAPFMKLPYPAIARLWPVFFVFALGILSRWLFRSQLIQEWDAGNFVMAVNHFDLRQGIPHLPGTFVLFVFAGRALTVFWPDPHTSLVMVSVLASGLAAVALLILGRAWFNPRVGWAAALLMLSSPSVWFYGEMSLSYMAEFFWVVPILFTAYYAGQGDREASAQENRRALWILAALMGLAGGIRPNTPVFLMPLAIAALGRGLWLGKFSRRDVIVVLAIGFGSALVWLIPMWAMSGGPLTYWHLLQIWMHDHRQATRTIDDVLGNFTFLLRAIVFVLGFGMLPGLWALGRWRRSLLSLLRRDWRGQVLLLAIAPGFLYFLAVHIKRQGHSFTIMPALIILAAVAIVGLVQTLEPRYPRAWAIVLALVIGGNAAFFLFGPAEFRTRAKIQAFDRTYVERLAVIRANFPPATTAVLASKPYGRLPEVYLPDYVFPNLSDRRSEIPVSLPAQTRTLVLLDDKIYSKPEQDRGFQKLPLSGKGYLRYLAIPGDRQAVVSKDAVELVEPIETVSRPAHATP